MRILVSGGGTGGHLVPGLNLLRELRGDRMELHLVRPGQRVEDLFLRDFPELRVHSLPVSRSRIAAPFTLSKGILPARRLLARERIDLVVGLGGRGSLPSLVAAITRGTPFVLLEQNVVPGRAVKLVARFAQRVYTAFPETVRRLGRAPAIATGMPLRRGLGHSADPEYRRQIAGDAETVVLVIGGSQGAAALNRGLPRLFAQIEAARLGKVAFVHLAGAGKESEAARAYADHGLRAQVRAFADDMPALYAASDLVVCRGGGTTLIEVAAAARPAIVVPYPWHKDRQQYHNAEWFVARDAMAVLEQSQIEAGEGADLVAQFVRDPEMRTRMGDNGRRSVPIDAGPRIARELRRIAVSNSVTAAIEASEWTA